MALLPVLTVLPLELVVLGLARLMARFVARFEIPAGGLLELICSLLPMWKVPESCEPALGRRSMLSLRALPLSNSENDPLCERYDMIGPVPVAETAVAVVVAVAVAGIWGPVAKALKKRSWSLDEAALSFMMSDSRDEVGLEPRSEVECRSLDDVEVDGPADQAARPASSVLLTRALTLSARGPLEAYGFVAEWRR